MASARAVVGSEGLSDTSASGCTSRMSLRYLVLQDVVAPPRPLPLLLRLWAALLPFAPPPSPFAPMSLTPVPPPLTSTMARSVVNEPLKKACEHEAGHEPQQRRGPHS